MLDYILGTIAEHRWLFAGVILAGLAAWVIIRRHQLFWVTDLAYTVPVIGRISRFSSDYAKAHDGWLNVEKTLCRDYAKHVPALSRAEFENHAEYLRRTYDHGRKPLPFAIVALLAVLIGLEALGFSYLLGSLMALEGSENTRTLLMIAVVTVLAIVLLWLTHAAGHQLYRPSLLRKLFREHQVDNSREFTSRTVKLNEPQSIDDDQPDHVQAANRIAAGPGDRGSYSMVWVAMAFILVVAIGSTVLRIETLNSIEQEAAAPAASIFGAVEGGAEGEAAAPPVAATPEPGAEARHNAALTGFTLLGAIFLVTQFIGMRVGYSYGFVGLQSAEAHRATEGAADYASYWARIQAMIDIANLRLQKLHQKLEAGAHRPLEFHKSFVDFLREERGRSSEYMLDPADPGTGGPGGRGRPTLVPNAAEAVDRAVEALDKAPTNAAKLEILEGLDDRMQDLVEERLRARTAAGRREQLRTRFAGLY
ncbi:MAG: hypothetical protein DCF31_09970 [Alphaproteobacteria bacterium]|nr:MAG: hypothetical protein DCF31_09970 [Alphaproteobacteria bacterium]